MTEPVQRRGEWWHEQPDGTWLKWLESEQRWEPQSHPPPPPGAPIPPLVPIPPTEEVTAARDLWDGGTLLLHQGERAQVIATIPPNRLRIRNSRGQEGTVYTDFVARAPGSGPMTPVPLQQTPPRNGLAVAALVLGLVAILFGFIPLTFWIALICGALALIFGVLSWGRAANQPEVGRKGFAVAGVVLGLIGCGLGIGGAFFLGEAVTDVEDVLNEFDEEFGAGVPEELAKTLASAATAQESYAVEHGGHYTPDLEDIEREGFVTQGGVSLTIVRASTFDYCMEATDGTETASISSVVTGPEPGECE